MTDLSDIPANTELWFAEKVPWNLPQDNREDILCFLIYKCLVLDTFYFHICLIFQTSVKGTYFIWMCKFAAYISNQPIYLNILYIMTTNMLLNCFKYMQGISWCLCYLVSLYFIAQALNFIICTNLKFRGLCNWKSCKRNGLLSIEMFYIMKLWIKCMYVSLRAIYVCMCVCIFCTSEQNAHKCFIRLFWITISYICTGT